MARNGSGTMTPSVDFTTEAASPPIEISKLDTLADDIAAELTNSIAADGQTNPSANLPMNGFRHTNVGAASSLTHYGRVSEIIDQDYIFYVDSGSANTLVITPSPAIAAYEEGQRFVVRAANNNSGATTLNVNGLGAIAVQTPDSVALASGAILQGQYYEFTYDANSTPDRWILTSPSSDFRSAALLTGSLPAISGASLTGLNGTNISSGTVADARLSSQVVLKDGAINSVDNLDAADPGYRGMPVAIKSSDYTLVLADAGKLLVVDNAACDTITIPANASVAFPVGTMIGILIGAIADTVSLAITTDSLTQSGVGSTGTRTLAQHAEVYIKKITSTAWYVSGTGLS